MHGTKGMIPLHERKPIPPRTLKVYRDRSSNYRWIQCRKNFHCHNEQCDKRIISYCDYYYKYEGRLDWNYRYYNLWSKICSDCYYNYVLDPSSQEWIRHMGIVLEREGRTLDSNRAEVGLPASGLNPELRRRR